jgi:hypothetical protein
MPMPALLATAAVHHHLVRQGLRMNAGLVVETGEAREVHHFCVLAGYGAEAINPYLAFETLEALRAKRHPDLPAYKVQQNFIKAIGKGIRKVMSKMGISTYQSYCGAQIFDAVGLAEDFIEDFFTGTATTKATTIELPPRSRVKPWCLFWRSVVIQRPAVLIAVDVSPAHRRAVPTRTTRYAHQTSLT